MKATGLAFHATNIYCGQLEKAACRRMFGDNEGEQVVHWTGAIQDVLPTNMDNNASHTFTFLATTLKDYFLPVL